jgi:hypothetical protein
VRDTVQNAPIEAIFPIAHRGPAPLFSSNGALQRGPLGTELGEITGISPVAPEPTKHVLGGAWYVQRAVARRNRMLLEPSVGALRTGSRNNRAFSEVRWNGFY